MVRWTPTRSGTRTRGSGAMSPNVNDRDANVQASEAAVRPPTTDAVAAATAILRRLTPAARDLLDVAAVAGPSFHAEDVAEVLGEPVPGILGALREAVEGGFLEPRNSLLSFRSSSLQAALYAAIPEAVRPALHRAIGLVLIGRSGSAALAASHLVVGLQPGDRVALAALTRAAADLTATAPAEAADLVLRLLELTPPEDEGRLARILVGVGALTAAGRLPEAVALAHAGLASSRLPESVAARLHLKLSALHLAGGRTADAVAAAEAALGVVRPSAMVETVIAVAPDSGTRPRSRRPRSRGRQDVGGRRGTVCPGAGTASCRRHRRRRGRRRGDPGRMSRTGRRRPRDGRLGPGGEHLDRRAGAGRAGSGPRRRRQSQRARVRRAPPCDARRDAAVRRRVPRGRDGPRPGGR